MNRCEANCSLLVADTKERENGLRESPFSIELWMREK